MNTIFILFTVDAWHTNASKSVAGVFSEKKLVFSYIEKEKLLLIDDLKELRSNDQTQGLSLNYMIEEWTIDYLINYV